MSFTIGRLSSNHDRTGFASGSEPLDRYFRQQVGQDVRRRVTACFVAVDGAGGEIAGYDTLAAGAMLLADLPEDQITRLPRYPCIPVARLGRLAVAEGWQGQKLGAALLWDAVVRAARSELMADALVVDARDETAAAFYQHHGFHPFAANPLRLMLPLARVRIRIDKSFNRNQVVNNSGSIVR